MNTAETATRSTLHTKARPTATLTRSILESGLIESLYAQDSPWTSIASTAERAASLRRTMSTRPTGDVWIFGYGSLIWNPAMQVAEKRVARLDGWRRSFCLSITVARATASRPSLMLGLERGGSCLGMAFRLAEEDLASELELLWRREMLCGAYRPRWVELEDADGEVFGNAIAFTVDPASPQYVGCPPRHTVVQRLATASGSLGSAADYLFRTRDSLRVHGIPDLELEYLSAQVEVAIALHQGSR